MIGDRMNDDEDGVGGGTSTSGGGNNPSKIKSKGKLGMLRGLRENRDAVYEENEDNLMRNKIKKWWNFLYILIFKDFNISIVF